MKLRAAAWWTIGAMIAIALLYAVNRPHRNELVAPRVSPPDLSHQPIRLRVAHAINPRLPQLSTSQIAAVLEMAQEEARRTFSVAVIFEPVVEIPIKDLFARMPANLADSAHYAAYHRTIDAASLAGLREDFVQMLKSQPQRAGEYRTYVARAFPSEAASTSLSQTLAQIQQDRLLRWKSVRAADGEPVIDSDPYNEYTYWNALGNAGIPYDLVLTNQLVASAERGAAVVHVALRGGVSMGGTTYNRGSVLGTFSFVTTFALLSDDGWVRSIRDGDSYASEEVTHYAALVLLHELGHQLFHYGDVFDTRACIMGPTPQLRFREWAEGMAANGCPRSHPQMQRGAASMLY